MACSTASEHKPGRSGGFGFDVVMVTMTMMMEMMMMMMMMVHVFGTRMEVFLTMLTVLVVG